MLQLKHNGVVVHSDKVLNCKVFAKIWPLERKLRSS